MESLPLVHDGALDPARFEEVLDEAHVRLLREGMRRAQGTFEGRAVWHVNSTARGGGVAEMLHPLLAYARGAGVDTRWAVIQGDDLFFRVTKRIHNFLHGDEGDGGMLDENARAAYERTALRNAEALVADLSDHDVVVLHDPQTAGLIPAVRERGVPVVWRCHIGADADDERVLEAQRFLVDFVRQADALVFSREDYIWHGIEHDRVTIIKPTIDAFSPKNQELDTATARAILQAAGLRGGEPAAAPAFRRMDGRVEHVRRRATVHGGGGLGPDDRFVLQVSRWDALKDPLGVIGGFAEHVAHDTDAHLVYAGPAVEAVADDPEGAAVLHAAQRTWEELPSGVRERVHLALLPMEDLEENAAIVNALQREAAVVVQKSLAEGFGLTVAEAMWKARPVVASRVGGIQDQIEHGASGLLLDDARDLAAYGEAVLEMLRDEARAAALGHAARERVRDHFLGSESLLHYLDLLQPLLEGR